MVAERVVLRRVEHLQEGRRRIARPAAGRELVDLVEQHDRVHRARLDEGADDPARLRPDVGAAVTADLRLVADAAERDAHELASHRPGDGLAETRLADPWRADEGDDRAVAAPAVALALVETTLVPELAGGEELDDAVLDVVEAVVVVVEHALGVLEIDGVVAAVVPRQLEDAIEPGADPRVLGRLGARALEPVELLGDRGAHTVGRVELVEPGAILADDVVVALAELLADRGELLAQQELALLLVDTLADVVADRLGDLQLGEMAAGPRHDQLDSRRNVDRPQDGESRGVVELGPQGDRVGERAGVEVAAQQLGQAPRTPQFGDQLEDGAQLAGRRSRSTATGRGSRRTSCSATSAPRSSRSMATTRARVSTWTIATGSPVGNEPMSGTLARTPSSCSSPPVSSRGPPSAASTARRNSSVVRGMVTTAPGRITVDRWAMGRRERTPELVMDRRVPIRNLIDTDSGFLTADSWRGHPSRPRKGASAWCR